MITINKDELTGLIFPILLWLLGRCFSAIANYFKSKAATLERMEQTLIEMKYQLKSYDQTISEIPKLKKEVRIIFHKLGLMEVPDLT